MAKKPVRGETKPQNRGGSRPGKRRDGEAKASRAARDQVEAELRAKVDDQQARSEAAIGVRRRGDGTFEKGVSGNPGGRPKSLGKVIAELSKDGEGREIIQFAFDVMRGDLKIQARTMFGEPYLAEPPMKERRACAEWLGDQLFGKARQRMEVTGKDGGPVQTEGTGSALLRHATDDELDQLERMAAEMAARAASDAEQESSAPAA